MRRHFYLSDDLDDLERLESDLEARGIARPQIHILSNNDAGLESHHLHQVESLLRKDVIHSGKIGFLIGLVAAAIPLVIAYIVGLSESYLWIPVIFLSIILLGFCTWEGGLIGIQRPNHQYLKFERAINSGRHLLIVDVDPGQEKLLLKVIADHPNVEDMGLGQPVPGWLVGAQKQWQKFVRWAP
ncbi:NAD/FAD-utilizing enzyme [Marinimicrobium sp. C6131]|uniref:NAD/FAD-utilizing enzyme n=1 Tax=Marinimicrobium sp. C6131 TaxID=3022676 RepID=UPI00223D6FC1|nr:NAD/FAD-utilizing enzyme [Marinimicrobium sp. C6131]UZJ44756.1 NAD/FAD-utilizing enzyme [Marinimicrobium sp. C6131]